MLKKKLGKLVALALVGASIATMPVADARSTDTVKINAATDEAASLRCYWRLEKDTIIDDMVIGGTHYVGAWVQYYTKSRVGLYIVDFFSSKMNSKDFETYKIYLFKFSDDGKHVYYSGNYSKEGSTEHTDDSSSLSNLMELFLASDENIDYLNPYNWNTDIRGWRGEEDEAGRKIAEYIQKHHKDIVANNIALNKRDEANAPPREKK